MSKNLVIVESPAKAKTIEKYLGKDFFVLASYGHVRDLLPKEGAVDPGNQFDMKYEINEQSRKHIQTIVKELKKADTLYLATDPDREGEAISWHLQDILMDKKALKNKQIYRVVFHEITEKAILEAMEKPRELLQGLVNAYKARRALDYLVGFNLSPLLWKKIRRGLSAGRVQSPALRMIAERELEIDKFEKQEYWTIEASLTKDKSQFNAKLTQLDNEKIKQFTINSEALATSAQKQLIDAANGVLTVVKIEKKKRRRSPAAPFITSTLQQEASRKLGFTTQRTMRTAQQLYEGIDIGGETVGLITYMRTDSVILANDAVEEIRQYIHDKYGAESVPDKPNTYKTKAKNAQEAHEAIRTTSILREPNALKAFLSKEQFRLYELIWKRTVACQMINATINTVGIDFSCGKNHLFRASGSTIANPGFMAVYLEDMDDTKKDDSDEKLLPEMEEGESIPLHEIIPAQHFTEPPPRYTEASLVKALEEHGIGRPSTYATIISTLQNREYVKIEKKRFFPSDVGIVVSKFLTQHFNQYVDYDFTAKLEDELDAVSRGEKEWIPLMDSFWTPFIELIKDKEKNVNRKDVTQEPIDEECPKCNKQLSIMLGKTGRFIGCTGYPDCNYTRSLHGDEESTEPEIVEGRKCPKCESDLVIKTGRYGKFIGCGSYPACKHIEPLEKPTDTGVSCPECDKGSLLKRKSRNGKIFYSCSEYPKCKYAIWNEPVNEPCPECNWPILSIKTTKRKGTEKVCPQKTCKYAIPFEIEENEAEAEA